MILNEYFDGGIELEPDFYLERIEEHGLERTVCDWLAGMTDRFAEQEYERLRGRSPRSNYPVG